MTGLNLETFLRLVRADVGPWISFSAIVCLLALMAWTSWGRKKALRKCLVLSIVAHFVLLLYGGPQAAKLLVPATSTDSEESVERIRRISIVQEGVDGPEASATKSARGRLSDWDRPSPLLAAADLKNRPERAETPDAEPLNRSETPSMPDPVADAQAPAVELPTPVEVSEPPKSSDPEPPTEAPTELARTLPDEEAKGVVDPVKPAEVPTLTMPDVVSGRVRSRSAPKPERSRSATRVEPTPIAAQAAPPGPEIAAVPVESCAWTIRSGPTAGAGDGHEQRGSGVQRYPKCAADRAEALGAAGDAG